MKKLLLTLVAFLAFGSVVAVSTVGEDDPFEIQSFEAEDGFILVDKGALMLTVFDASATPVLTLPVCCGSEFGDKQTLRDCRTPEGVFRVRRIENSTTWPHKLPGGRKEFGSYGPTFIRLEYPPIHRIGIHGTKLPESIGKRESEGCVRLRNEDLALLVPHVKVGMKVLITPGAEDIRANDEFRAEN